MSFHTERAIRASGAGQERQGYQHQRFQPPLPFRPTTVLCAQYCARFKYPSSSPAKAWRLQSQPDLFVRLYDLIEQNT